MRASKQDGNRTGKNRKEQEGNSRGMMPNDRTETKGRNEVKTGER